MNWVLARIHEPSTHAGIAGLLQALASFLPQYAIVFNTLTGLFATVAVIKSDSGSAPK